MARTRSRRSSLSLSLSLKLPLALTSDADADADADAGHSTQAYPSLTKRVRSVCRSGTCSVPLEVSE